MNNFIQINSSIYIPIVIIVFTILIVLWSSIVPMEQREENIPLLNAIVIINLLLSIAIYCLLYLWNANNQLLKNNIIHLSLACTFLIALPATLYSLGVTSLIYSNT